MALTLFLPHLFKSCDFVELDWAVFVVSFYTSTNALYLSKNRRQAVYVPKLHDDS